MKKLLILLTFGTFLAAGACTADRVRVLGIDLAGAKRIKGSGTLVTRTLPLPAFDALRTSRSVTVHLVAGGERIVVEADDNLIDYVTVTAEDKVLHVSIDPRIQAIRHHITVNVPTDGKLRLLKASSSSDIVSEVPIEHSEVLLDASSKADIVAAVNAESCILEASSSADIHAGIRAGHCSIKASSSAEIKAAVVSGTCTVRSSSSADVELTGEADQCVAECSSSSDYEAARFAVKVYDIRVSSSAEAEIRCTERLAARASSSGSIDFTGECAVEKQVTSGGSVSKR